MGYIDKNGIRHEDTTSQDKVLRILYGNIVGRSIVKILTVPMISKMAGSILNLPFSKCAIPSFIRNNNINMDEYIPCNYSSYNDFFMRQIKPEARPIDDNPNTIISPSDGRVSVYKISGNGVFNIKNAPYTVETLLRDKELASKYEDGCLFLIRLCVNDYHRYCYAVSGTKSENVHINGIFHTVNPVASEYFPIYKENTREYTIIHSEQFGDVIQMEVGAMMVGKIVNDSNEMNVSRGQEKGHFEFGGSTIILLTEKNKIKPVASLISNTLAGYETIIKQGEVLAIKAQV